jgi:hypothetical protein
MSSKTVVFRVFKAVELLMPNLWQGRISILLTILLIISACQRLPELAVNESLVCDLETISEDKKDFIPSTHPNKRISSADRISTVQARSGEHSIMLKKDREFGLTCFIKDSNADEYYEAIIWRKGEDNTGSLAVSDEHNLLFNKSENIPDSIDPNGWERLRLAFHVPPRLKNVALKFYVWNPGDKAAYFDDLSISRKNPEPYPEYKNLEGLKIFVDTLNALKILNKRDEAFRKGILETQDDDWADGMMFSGEDLYKIELRLKGDWLDHLVGSKWSFRIETDKGTTWRGMRTFSVQSPKTRDFLNEWLMLKFCRMEDILATRFGFIPLEYNGRSLGIYAWEEHFEKFLVESNSRREGPILKVNENAMWKTNQIAIRDDRDYWLPFIPSAEILPFKSKRTSRDSTLLGQYKIAQELYYQYKFAEIRPSDIFDVEKMAKYLAMLDLFGTYHGITWHNQRFYFNPVVARLEPIAFDNFSDVGHVKYTNNAILGNYYSEVDKATDNDFLLAGLFRDSLLGATYAHYLEKYSKDDFIRSLLLDLDPEIKYYDSLLRREYPTYRFDPDYLFQNARAIREELPSYQEKLTMLDWSKPEFKITNPQYDADVEAAVSTYFVKAYTYEKDLEERSIVVKNHFTRDIILLGTARNDKRIRNYLYPEIRVEHIDGRNPGKTIIKAGPEDDYLYFMVDGDMITYPIPVYPWPAPDGKATPRQKINARYGTYYKELFVLKPEQNLVLEKGDYRIDKPLLIPPGYTVTFEPGVNLNIVEEGAFISHSTINMVGSQQDPIIIKSSDGSANGFTVLQAAGRSYLEHVIFDRLNTLDIEGWKLTGAVTFYESDVDFYQVSFRNNLCEDGLNIIRSSFSIDQCELLNTFSDALDVDFGQGSITNTQFKYLSNDAIDVSGSEVVIDNCLITQSDDKGISGGENSKVEVFNTTILGTRIGIASKDQSRMQVSTCILEDCNYGIIVFRKKPEFGPAFFEGENIELNNITTVFLVEKGSKCAIDGKIIPDDKENIYELFYE